MMLHKNIVHYQSLQTFSNPILAITQIRTAGTKKRTSKHDVVASLLVALPFRVEQLNIYE